MCLHDKLQNSDVSAVSMKDWQPSYEDVEYSLCVDTMYSEYIWNFSRLFTVKFINTLNAKVNPFCHLLALL
jgi:hypothetical protein